MAAAFVADLEILGFVMYSVWCTMLPCVKLPLGGTLIAVVTIGGVC